MRNKFLYSILILLLTLDCIAQVRVSGYYRKNGTYVQPHYRSNPDGNPYNNWSYPGNVNPYTGKVATGNADTYLDNYYNRNSSSRTYTTTSSNSYSNTSSSNSYNQSSTSSNSSYYSGSTSSNTYNNTSSGSRTSNAKTVNVNNQIITIDLSNLTTTSREYYISTLKANLRLGPTIHSSALEQIDFGSKVYLIEKYDRYWSKILYKLKNEVDEKHYVVGFVNTSFLSSTQSSNYQSNYAEQESEPEKLVRDFLTDLGNRNFYSAYSKSKNPIWKTYEWFSSTSAYGGIDKVVIYEIKLENIFDNEAIVYANYFANDVVNSSGTYKQIFVVKYIDNSWKITRAKLVDK